ncbi:MAG: DKNYY domain-containing protein [Candidatus Sericytochromatia bacterium]
MDRADAASFRALDTSYARDKSSVYVDGRPLPGADPASFELLQRPGFAKDSRHVYQRDRPISDDTAHFQLLDAGLAKDSVAVYWSDGTVLSKDPSHFAVVSVTDNYLFAKDGRTVYVNGRPIPCAEPASFRVLRGAYATDDQSVFYFTDKLTAEVASFRALHGPYASDARNVYWMGKPIPDADPVTFRVLNADFECSADHTHAYYRQSVIAGADPRSFPPGRGVTGCTETSISFAQ